MRAGRSTLSRRASVLTADTVIRNLLGQPICAATGYNAFGQLGINSTANALTPQTVVGGIAWRQ